MLPAAVTSYNTAGSKYDEKGAQTRIQEIK